MIFYRSRRLGRRSFFLLCFFLAGTAVSKNADYWIIENPAALVIYSQYEQRLSAGEKSLLPAFSAWEILSSSLSLSDQFTRAVKTRFNNQLYYLQVTDQDDPVNRELAGKIEIIKNAIVFNDTIRIKNSDRFFLSSGYSRHKLSEGLLLRRQFQTGRRIFVSEVDGQTNGWLEGGRSADYELYRVDEKTAAYETKLFHQAVLIFQTYNKRLEKLFSYLNLHNAQSRQPPQWTGNSSSAQLIYKMQPVAYQDRFPTTRTYLLQELNDLLHGSDYVLVLEGAAITIKRLSR